MPFRATELEAEQRLDLSPDHADQDEQPHDEDEDHEPEAQRRVLARTRSRDARSAAGTLPPVGQIDGVRVDRRRLRLVRATCGLGHPGSLGGNHASHHRERLAKPVQEPY
jgi:hypothetical protein